MFNLKPCFKEAVAVVGSVDRAAINTDRTSSTYGHFIVTYSNGETKDYGIVTAYSAAVAAGYGGTEAQWKSDIANVRAYATGQKYSNGSLVELTSGDVGYKNNAKYWADEASGYARGYNTSGNSLHNEESARYYAQQANTERNAAATARTAAENAYNSMVNMTVGLTIEPPEGEASVTKSKVNGVDHLQFKIPKTGDAPSESPIFTGSISMGRKANTETGMQSVAVGNNVEASGAASVAEGMQTKATHAYQHVEGTYNVADDSTNGPTAKGKFLHIAGNGRSESARSNAYTLDWNGNAEFAGDVVAKACGGDSPISVTALSNNKADKEDTLLTTTLSRGRKDGTATGVGSFAFGSGVTASGEYSNATGNSTAATGPYSNAEGYNSKAEARSAHAEGSHTQASGIDSHAENGSTIANARNMHASGSFNVSATLYPEWVSGATYEVGDRVTSDGYGYECTVANSDTSISMSKWKALPSNSDTAFVIGNGTTNASRSNAFELDWEGNGAFKGSIFSDGNGTFSGDVIANSGAGSDRVSLAAVNYALPVLENIPASTFQGYVTENSCTSVDVGSAYTYGNVVALEIDVTHPAQASQMYYIRLGNLPDELYPMCVSGGTGINSAKFVRLRNAFIDGVLTPTIEYVTDNAGTYDTLCFTYLSVGKPPYQYTGSELPYQK